jgi:hypothetical protein
VNGLAEIIRFRILMIAAGHEDGNDADALRRDLPAGEELCSQSTISRLENLLDRRALLRLGPALVEQYCGSFRAVPKRIILDIDDTFDRVHGGQQLRLFNAYYDDYGFQPIVVFDAEGRLVTAPLRPGKPPSGGGDPRLCAPPDRRPAQPLAKGRDPDSHYASPECSTGAGRTGWIGSSAWPPTPHSAVMSQRWRRAPPRDSRRRPGRGKVRRFGQFHDAAQSWSRVEPIIARVEAGLAGTDTRFIVTSLEGGRANQCMTKIHCDRAKWCKLLG